MKMYQRVNIILCSLFLLYSCSKENDASNVYKLGKNRYTIELQGDIREYYVHVPKSYDPQKATDVVFMLHGTSGNGEKFYDGSGWKEVGEANNILTIFPSSWKYCIIDQDGAHTTTKWNTTPDTEFTFCPNNTGRDDIAFLKAIIADLQKKFNVNDRRIYLVGFSNGGQMAAKCAIEMSDVFAAIVESAGSFTIDTVYTPKRKLPVLFQIGNDDYGPGNSDLGPTIPLSALDTLLSTPGIGIRNGRHYFIAQAHIKYFMLNPQFTISGDTSTIATASYTPANSADQHTFHFLLINGLGHAYPNGTNHWYKSAENNWSWMKNFTR